MFTKRINVMRSFLGTISHLSNYVLLESVYYVLLSPRGNSKNLAYQTMHHGKWLKLRASAGTTAGLFQLYIRYGHTFQVNFHVSSEVSCAFNQVASPLQSKEILRNYD